MTATSADPLAKSPGRLALRSMAWLLLFSILARGAGFFKEMALANRFGVGALTDAYVLGFTWVVWLPSIFASIAMATIVPTVARLAQRSRAETELFYREFAGLTVVTGLALALLTAGVPLLADAGITLEPSLATTLPAMAWMVPAFFVATFGSTRLVASHRHANLALEAVPPLLLTMVLLAPVEVDLRWLCLATSASFVVYAACVLMLMRHHGEPIGLRLGFRSEGWKALASAASVLLIGNLCAGSLMVVDQMQAATLGEGSVSILGYASRLLMLPAVLLSMLIARAMLPVFSEMQAREQPGALTGLVLRFMLAALGIGAVGAAAVWMLAPELVALAFERGSFTGADTVATASALRWGILQLPGYLGGIVLVQALLSRRQFGAVAASGIFNLLAKVALNAWLGPLMGVDGIALATSIVLSISFFILLFSFLGGRSR